MSAAKDIAASPAVVSAVKEAKLAETAWPGADLGAAVWLPVGTAGTSCIQMGFVTVGPVRTHERGRDNALMRRISTSPTSDWAFNTAGTGLSGRRGRDGG